MTQVHLIDKDTLYVDYAGDGSRTATLHRTGRLIIAGYGSGILDRVVVDTTYNDLNKGIIRIVRDMARFGYFLDATQTEIVFGF